MRARQFCRLGAIPTIVSCEISADRLAESAQWSAPGYNVTRATCRSSYGPEIKSGPKFRKSAGSRPQAGRLRWVDGEVIGSASILDFSGRRLAGSPAGRSDRVLAGGEPAFALVDRPNSAHRSESRLSRVGRGICISSPSEVEPRHACHMHMRAARGTPFLKAETASREGVAPSRVPEDGGPLRTPGTSALPLRAHARSRACARRHRARMSFACAGRCSPKSLCSDINSPGCTARWTGRALRGLTGSPWSCSPRSRRPGGTHCESSNPRPFFAGTAPASRLSGGSGAEHAPRRASLRRRPPWSGPWPRQTDSGAPRGSAESCSSSGSASPSVRSKSTLRAVRREAGT